MTNGNWRQWVVGLAGVCVLGTATANDLDLSLNDDVVRLNYSWPARADKLVLDVGILHNQDLGEVVNIGLHLVDFATEGSNPIRAGLGGKIFYSDTDTPADDELSLGLGGFLSYTLPNYNRFSLRGALYYAPEILSFGDSEEFVELEGRINYNVLRDADIFIGARYIGIEFEGGGKLRMDTGIHAGIQLRF